MPTKNTDIEQLFKQLKNGLEQLMTIEQKKFFQKLTYIYKDLIKNQKELGFDSNSQFYTSIKLQFYTLKKDILNNKKFSMSDYEAFLWNTDFKKTRNHLFLYIKPKKIIEKITLPKRAICIDEIPKASTMKELSFCPLGHSINNIVGFALEIMYENSYCEKNFKKETMQKLIYQIANEYEIVGYHNFTHAFSVKLMLFQCYQHQSKFKNMFSPFEIFISYLSALAHDIGHKGTNSDYQVKKKSELAKLYSNESVLENMHISKFCKLLRKYPQIDIISQIKDSVQKQRSKRLMIRLILGTDVSKHFNNLEKLKTADLVQKQIIYENLFHACDIGNGCLKFGDFMNWALLLSNQFNAQYEMEIQLGLEPTTFFKYNGLKVFYKGQYSFLEGLVLPLWKKINNMFEGLGPLTENIAKNLEQLKKLVEQTSENELQD